MGRRRKAPPTWPVDDTAVAAVLGVTEGTAARIRRGVIQIGPAGLGRLHRAWPTMDLDAVCAWFLAEDEK